MLGSVVAALVVVAVVLGCVFGLANTGDSGEQQPVVEKEDNRTKGEQI